MTARIPIHSLVILFAAFATGTRSLRAAGPPPSSAAPIVHVSADGVAYASHFEYQGKTLEEWVRGEGVASSGFADGVESWGVEAIPAWLRLLAPDRSTAEGTAAHTAIAMLLRERGLLKTRTIAEEVAVPVLLPLLKEPKGWIRGRTMNTLRALGPAAKAAVPELLAVLRNPNDADAERFSTRNMAALALGEIHDPPELIVPALCEALQDDDPRLRGAAASALRSMSWRAVAAIPAIEAATKDADADFQKAAATALAEIRRPAPPGIGDVLPSLELSALGGTGKRQLTEFKGQVVVLDFWSATCPPCQPAMAHLEELARTRKEWRGKVALVGISEDGSADAARRHSSKRGWTNVQLLFDEDQRAHRHFRASLPEVILADRSGKIVWRGHPTEIALETEIERLLQEAAAP